MYAAVESMLFVYFLATQLTEYFSNFLTIHTCCVFILMIIFIINISNESTLMCTHIGTHNYKTDEKCINIHTLKYGQM